MNHLHDMTIIQEITYQKQSIYGHIMSAINRLNPSKVMQEIKDERAGIAKLERDQQELEIIHQPSL